MNKLWATTLVKASIFTADQEIVSGSQELQPNIPNFIAIKLPNALRNDTYYIKIEGKLPTGELMFSNQSELIFDQKALTIIIQTEKPDYRQFQMLNFRVIPIYPDLSGYYGTLDVLIYAPAGFILKRWQNIQTNAGVVSLSYLIGDAPTAGWWTIKAIVMGYEETKRFEVYEFYEWKYEVKNINIYPFLLIVTNKHY